MATDKKTERLATPARPYLYLALAILAQAITDARNGDRGAARWLAESGPDWLDLCGLDFDRAAWAGWIRAGCPPGGAGDPRRRNWRP